jgi:ribosomal protein S18 acetylase RimI-like enzyme
MFFQKKNKLKIRQAKIEDIPQILDVEIAAWGKERALTYEMLKSEIKTFPEGTLVAILDDKVVGVITTEIVNYDLEKDAFTWYEITDNGYIKNTHNPKGNTLYGVSLSIHPFYQNKGIGKELMIAVGKLAIKYNLKQGLLGARIPHYHKYADKIKVEDYVKITQKDQNDIPPDPELMFYQRLGLKIIKIIPNYFDDPESLNYGVLMLWKNPFYNKWYRKIAAVFFRV